VREAVLRTVKCLGALGAHFTSRFSQEKRIAAPQALLHPAKPNFTYRWPRQ
jgi:hypothetical protein